MTTYAWPEPKNDNSNNKTFSTHKEDLRVDTRIPFAKDQKQDEHKKNESMRLRTHSHPVSME